MSEFTEYPIGWFALSPILALVVGALVLLLAGALTPQWPRGLYAFVAALTAGTAGGLAMAQWDDISDRGPSTLVGGALAFDTFAQWLVLTIAIAVILVSMLTAEYLRGTPNDGPEVYALYLVAAAGGATMAAANDLIVLFLGLETLSLALYVLGFSFAYVTLDTGLGALLLFGGVQITMFVGALVLRESIPPIRWIGAGIAFAGLAWILWPAGRSAPDPLGAALMLAAALGWGLYSLIGRKARAPLDATAWSFALALPAGLVAAWAAPGSLDWAGVGLAVASGALTSGLGYALWYAVLPGLGATVAAVAQLTVPILAMAGGMLALGEPLTLRFVLAAALVLGGVGLSLTGLRRPA